MNFRIGYGYDSHEFKRGVPLKIGGVTLEHTHGLAGHSDGDVLLHAVTDALLGAVAAGDIGSFFPPTDERWRGANSVIFLEEAMRQIEGSGYRVANIDSSLILAQPKIRPYTVMIQARLAELLKVDPGCVGVKAKTPEGLNLDDVAQAHAMVLLEKVPEDADITTRVVVAEIPTETPDEIRSAIEEPAATGPEKSNGH